MREYLTEEKTKVIKKVLRNNPRNPKFVKFNENKFYFGLLAIDIDGDILSKQKLSLYAKQFLYAEKNGIMPQLLIGFLYQMGNSSNLTKRLAENGRDPSLNLMSVVQRNLGV